MTNSAMSHQSQDVITIPNSNTHKFDVKQFTNAPLQISITFEINQSPEKVFELMSVDFIKWFDGVDTVNWNNEKSENKGTLGKGSARFCHMGKKILNERINQFSPPNIFSYSVDSEKSTMKFPIYDHCAVIFVKKNNNKGGIVTWKQYYRKKFHPLSLIITPMMKNMMLIKNIKNLLKTYKGKIIS